MTEPYTHGEVLTPPTCPICGTNEYVARDIMGGKRVWLCSGQCWTVFTGEQGEWERNRARREMRTSARAARGQGPQREVTP